MIWEALATQHDSDATTTSTALYTCVCRQWQPFFEAKNFERILLSPQRVTEFPYFLRDPRKRRLVKHIWLRIELPSYDCTACHTRPVFREHTENMAVFRNAIGQLFHALCI